MSNFRITPRLLGTLAECYYKEFCAQRGWAYSSLEVIYKNKFQEERLEFKLAFERIMIHIPKEIRHEIETISKPSNSKEDEPSFVYDFLACKAWNSKQPRFLDETQPDDFCWVEVKGGRSSLTPNQLDTALKIKIPLIICRVPNIRAYPNKIKVYWNTVEEDLTIQDRISERDILV